MNARVSVDAIVGSFAATFGRNAQGVWAAPGRVNLIGEHTDYNDGFVLPFAIDRHAMAAVALRDDGKARCVSAELGAGPEVRLADIGPHNAPQGWSAYPLGVAWALTQTGVELPGFDLLVTSDVPLGAGISSSAALECCVALALAELAGAVIDRSELALAARRGENEIARAPTGLMDQVVSMQARAGHALLLDCRSLQWRHLPFDPAGHGLGVLVIDTQTRHALVSGAYGQRRRACEEAAHILGVGSLRDATEASLEAARPRLGRQRFEKALHVVSENARVLGAVAILEAVPAGVADVRATGDLRDLGALLSASHASLRDSFDVSCPELNSVCESAESAGAVGARMIGGGFGGSAIALTPTDRIEAVLSSVAAAAEKRSFPRPRIFAAHPAGGASRAG